VGPRQLGRAEESKDRRTTNKSVKAKIYKKVAHTHAHTQTLRPKKIEKDNVQWSAEKFGTFGRG